jgi:hypothetical protein
MARLACAWYCVTKEWAMCAFSYIVGSWLVPCLPRCLWVFSLHALCSCAWHPTGLCSLHWPVVKAQACCQGVWGLSGGVECHVLWFCRSAGNQQGFWVVPGYSAQWSLTKRCTMVSNAGCSGCLAAWLSGLLVASFLLHILSCKHAVQHLDTLPWLLPLAYVVV